MVGNSGPIGSFTLTWSGDLTVAKTPYETWADDNVGGGAPDEITDGIENAFRYAFGIASGERPPLQTISFDASGRPVLAFPSGTVADGVTLTLLSTTDLSDWSSAAVTERTVTLGADGTMTLDDDGTNRFYRLKASF